MCLGRECSLHATAAKGTPQRQRDVVVLAPYMSPSVAVCHGCRCVPARTLTHSLTHAHTHTHSRAHTQQGQSQSGDEEAAVRHTLACFAHVFTRTRAHARRRTAGDTCMDALNRSGWCGCLCSTSRSPPPSLLNCSGRSEQSTHTCPPVPGRGGGGGGGGGGGRGRGERCIQSECSERGTGGGGGGGKREGSSSGRGSRSRAGECGC